MQKIKAITPNPGGTLAPEQVLGRDGIIEKYWTILENRGLVLVAPRRIGKSSVCRRMAAEPPAGFRPIYRSLEGRASSPLDLARALFDDAEAYLGKGTKVLVRARRWLEKVGASVNTTWGSLKIGGEDWKDLLDAILDDLAEGASASGEKVVLFWDEFTVFLHDLAAPGPESARDAMVLLDRLRAARQRHLSLRMVYTGSIGLDEVIRSLHAQGYTNQPVNDMAKEILPLFEPADARDLSVRLLASFIPERALQESLAEHVARLCEGHPFLIQHVAERLRTNGGRTTARADNALRDLLEDAADPLELYQYLERLGRYLDPASRTLALRLLDALAEAAGPLDLPSLQERLSGADKETLLEVLHLLRRDLYVERTDGMWAFRLGFLRRYWVLERALDSANAKNDGGR